MIRSGDLRVRQIMEQVQKRQVQDPHQAAWDELRRIRYGNAAMPAGGTTTLSLGDGIWAGRRCFIVGGGPSLKGFDFSRLRGDLTIAVNRAFESFPADIMYAMDGQLHDWLTSGTLGPEARAKFEGFAGLKAWLDMPGTAKWPDVQFVRLAGDEGVPVSLADGIYHGSNSGYGALGLAIALGANPIYLLGYDMTGGGDGRQAWFHAGYPAPQSDHAYKNFINHFENTAAAISERGINVINLNPESALRCFEFGDVDAVLPLTTIGAGSTITAITPTGDRPLAFRLLREWMQNQTRRPDQWLVVDDGQIPMTPADGFEYVRREPGGSETGNTLNLNISAALPHVTGDKILIIEDDEYYAPGYVEEMARRLDGHEVVGIGDSRYYHLPTGGHMTNGNARHASLAQTGFRRSFLPAFESCLAPDGTPRWLDDRLWSLANAKGINREIFVDNDVPLYVGIKGLPGRGGIGIGHKQAVYRSHDDADRAMLRRWIPRDFQVYLDVLAGLE